MSHFICFDLEGPLSPQDNAYELMKLFPQGDKVFEAISRYDDLLTLEEREGYEPGDTLALIVPFLIYHGIGEADIRSLAQTAKLVEGAKELISRLYSRNWRVFCISTSYEQYAFAITQRVGIAQKGVACTSFPLDRYATMLCKEDWLRVERVGKEILSLRSGDEEQLKHLLDHFFWSELPPTELGKIMKRVKPVGGVRKVEALRKFAQDCGQSLGNFVAVGDSITDFKMLQAANQAGGLAIAFNANEYALPYASLGLASTHLSDLSPVAEAWERGGKEAARDVVKEKERIGSAGDREHFHWLEGIKDLTPILEIHRRIRRLVREEAARLG
jgi:energy-converting hydrogenase A subunit R